MTNFDPTKLTVRQLLDVYVGVLNELLRRGITRTRNAPLGDLMEHVAAKAYGGAVEANSKKSFDLIDDLGRRIQVKARAIELGKPPQTFSAFRSWEFEAAVFVVVDAATYEVMWARELSTEEAESLGRRRELTNSDSIGINAVKPLGTDVTDKIRTAYAELV